MKRPKLGDIFIIPVDHGKYAYGQFIFISKMGPIVQIFKKISIGEINLDELLLSDLLFQPVIVGLYAAIKEGLWNIVGNRSVITNEHPKFLTTNWSEKTGKAGMWAIWDGEKYYDIGHELPDQYKNYEYLIIWPPQMITERIRTGKTPFPYGDLIQNNEFTPIKKC